MKKNKLIYASILAFSITISGCKKDDPETPAEVTPSVSYSNGVFITNEGPYGTGTGTISFYSRSSGSVSANLFGAHNTYPLGNVVQSMEVFNSQGYIVVNNAGKVEVVDATSFNSQGAINNLVNPRYFLGINNSKGYVSQWGSGATGEVKVIDLATKAVTATINTGNGAEGMVKSGNNVYVACSGGYVTDSVVTVINTATDAVVTNITVGANPSSIKMDANGKIWVICGGEWNGTITALLKTGRLVRIDPTTNTVDFSLPFSSTTSSPSHLVINNTGTTLYYMYNGGVYSQSATSASLNATLVINRSFYGLGIDPTNNYFYGSDPGNFSSNGKVIRYNAAATVLDSFNVGLIPGNFCFQ